MPRSPIPGAWAMLRVRGLTSSPAGVLGLGLASIEMAIKAERDETEAGEEERKKKKQAWRGGLERVI